MKYGCETGSTSVSAAALCINRLSLAPGGLPCALNSVSPPPPFVCGFGVPFSSDSCLSGGFGSLGDSLFIAAHLGKNVLELFHVTSAEHPRGAPEIILGSTPLAAHPH